MSEHERVENKRSLNERIYDDRLEVWNPGKLPPDLSIEALYREHPSRPRNPRLAEAFYRARLIEHWGTGTLRIIQECEAVGMPRPQFIADMGEFIVRFTKAETEVERLGFPLNNRQGRAVDYVRQYGSITRSQYRMLVHVSASQAANDLAELVRAGVFIRKGRGRATEYVFVDPEVRQT